MATRFAALPSAPGSLRSLGLRLMHPATAAGVLGGAGRSGAACAAVGRAASSTSASRSRSSAGRIAPGPVVPTLLAALLIRRYGGDELQASVEAGARDGQLLGRGVGQRPAARRRRRSARSCLPVDGQWYALDAADLALTSTPGIDPTRRIAVAGTTPAPDPARRSTGLTDDEVMATAGSAARRRGGRRRGMVRRDRGRLREGARAVRPADRRLPGGQASLRRHAVRPRAGPGRGVGRRDRARRRRH